MKDRFTIEPILVSKWKSIYLQGGNFQDCGKVGRPFSLSILSIVESAITNKFVIIIGGHEHEVFLEKHGDCQIIKTGMNAEKVR